MGFIHQAKEMGIEVYSCIVGSLFDFGKAFWSSHKFMVFVWLLQVIGYFIH